MLFNHHYQPQQWPTPHSLKQSLQLLSQILTTGTLHYPPSTANLLRSLSHHSSSLTPFNLLRHLHLLSVPLQPSTFRSLFKSCSLSQALSAHALLVKLFPDSYPHVANSLVQMYINFGLIGTARRAFDLINPKDVVSSTTMVGGLIKCGMLDEARKLFDEMPERNVVSYTSMIAGYARAGKGAEAMRFFFDMLSVGIRADVVAVVSLLSACAQLRDLELGAWVHRLVEEERIPVNEILTSALIDMYAKCGDIEAAHECFDLMGSCRSLAAWNSLIDGYCKIGNIDAARELFDRMASRDIITFNSMITGYMRSSRLNEALQLFDKLRASGLCPDKFTMVGLLSACASSGSLSQGRAFHAYIESSSIEPDVFIGTALVDMYSKCGRMDEAMLMFDRMTQRDVLAWTAVISGLAMNGMGRRALEHFSSMVSEKIKPNAVAYIAVLNACSHSGLIEEGRKNFHQMKTLYNIEPEIEHYGCMVDLLGRCGLLEEAEQLIKSMPMKPNSVIWASLLNSCRVHKNSDLAERAAQRVLELEPDLDAGYVQLYHIYMDSGRQPDACRIRRLMEARGIRKTAGFSSVTVGSKAHKFVAGVKSHEESEGIEEMMREMDRRLRAAGYCPAMSRVVVEVEEEEKEEALFGHSERMAIAYGLMKLGGDLPIHVVKNLRVCEDCHGVIKLISKIWGRDIVVRDRSRFHHFGDGQCSCSDFW